MDTLRGNFADRSGTFDEPEALDTAEDDIGNDAPPSAVGQDERRMQVRAYNHWASQLGEGMFPSIDDLDPENLPDFGPFSVLLDFTSGIENPGINYLGEALAQECGTDEKITRLSDVPSLSLLSRITDHYMQIIANQAPIGFEAEFVNQQGKTILYRGILLPYSSDDETIDFIYGVINWKELADQATTDELLLQVDQALEAVPAPPPRRLGDEQMVDWADGPGTDSPGTEAPNFATATSASDGIIDLSAFEEASDEDALEEEEGTIPKPHFGYDEDADPEAGAAFDSDLELGLGDLLAVARDFADIACRSEERSRSALYDAISRAYDFSLAAAEEPEEFAELLDASGLKAQERAPMTPIVKLVFGSEYDKTRLTEYAAALSHAHRMELERGALGDFLRGADGGLKGVVKAERALRREESGKPAADASKHARIAEGLRKLEPVAFDTIPDEGAEFSLVMIRRLPSGEAVVLGEIPEDNALLDRAAKKLLG